MWSGATGILSQNDVKCLYGSGLTYMRFMGSLFAVTSISRSDWGGLGAVVKLKLPGRQRVVF